MGMKKLLDDAIKTLTYKPGWVFASEEFKSLDGSMILALNIQAFAVCVESGDPIKIDRSFILSDPTAKQSDLAKFLSSVTPPEFTIQYFITDCIHQIEDHEMKEWLKFDGKRFFDEPHDENGY